MINNEKFYTLTELLKLKILPWTSYITLKKWVDIDFKHDNNLGAIRRGTGPGSRYLIRGKNIIKFIAAIEDGTLMGGKYEKLKAFEDKF